MKRTCSSYLCQVTHKIKKYDQQLKEACGYTKFSY